MPRNEDYWKQRPDFWAGRKAMAVPRCAGCGKPSENLTDYGPNGKLCDPCAKEFDLIDENGQPRIIDNQTDELDCDYCPNENVPGFVKNCKCCIYQFHNLHK